MCNKRMKTFQVTMKNGRAVELQVDDNIADLMMSNDIDSATKSSIIKTLLADQKSDTSTSYPASTSCSSSTSAVTRTCTDTPGYSRQATPSPLPSTSSDEGISPSFQVHTWTGQQEDMLVSLRHEKNSSFLKTKNHQSLWLEISKELNEELHCSVSATQAMNKYYNLKKRWKEVIDSGTGTEAKYFRQRNQFDQMYGTRESTKPTCTMDSLMLSKETEEGTNSGEEENKEKGSKGKTKDPQNKKRKSSVIVDVLEAHNHEFKEQMERMHKEKMAKFDRLLDLYEKDIEKK